MVWKNKKLPAVFIAALLCLALSACGASSGTTSDETDQSVQEVDVDGSASDRSGEQEISENAEAPETPGAGASSVSNISSVGDVPLITLNNGVQVPQLGLGTQIQRLEQDSSESGRQLLNDTSHDAVVAALQAGYRHLDTAHGYFNERGVGQGIIDSGVPREEIWVTSKLWPSEYGEGITAQAIDDMLGRLQLDYLDCVYLHHPAGDYMAAYHDLEKAYRQGKVRAIGISNFDNWPEAFQQVMDESEIKPQIMQIECHPFAQRLETRALAEQYDMQVECWYPLGHADDRLLNNDVLSGKESKPIEWITVSFDYSRMSTHASNQMTIWIENESGCLVKTVLVTNFTAGRRGYRNRNMALSAWVKSAKPENSSDEEIDAITSATPAAGSLVYTWDMTDETGERVPDGRYAVKLEGTLFWESNVLYSAAFDTNFPEEELMVTELRSEPDNPENEEMIRNVRMEVIRGGEMIQ